MLVIDELTPEKALEIIEATVEEKFREEKNNIFFWQGMAMAASDDLCIEIPENFLQLSLQQLKELSARAYVNAYERRKYASERENKRN